MQRNLENMNLQELYDLLAEKTVDFLQLLEKRNEGGFEIRDMRLEVEKIQDLIKQKESYEIQQN